MKIERTDSLQNPSGTGKKKIENNTDKRFGDVLQATLLSSSAQPTAPLQGLPPAGSSIGVLPLASRKEMVGRADQLLHLLESCQSRLSAPNVTFQEAYASMRAVEDGADELTPYLDSLPEGDEFRDFLNRLVITASVEALKFRRGDYL